MRKTVKFSRVVNLLIPVWHQKESASSSKLQTKYRRPMAILELEPGREYQCADLQALLNRGAEFTSEDYAYVCSCGFIPQKDDLPLISTLTTGMDPEEELN